MSNNLTFEAFEKEWLADIVAGSPSTIELGRRFSRKVVSQWLDFAEDVDSTGDVVYCDGTGDGEDVPISVGGLATPDRHIRRHFPLQQEFFSFRIPLMRPQASTIADSP